MPPAEQPARPLTDEIELLGLPWDAAIRLRQAGVTTVGALLALPLAELRRSGCLSSVAPADLLILVRLLRRFYPLTSRLECHPYPILPGQPVPSLERSPFLAELNPSRRARALSLLGRRGVRCLADLLQCTFGEVVGSTILPPVTIAAVLATALLPDRAAQPNGTKPPLLSLSALLSLLAPAQERAIRLRFGLDDGRIKTWRQVGQLTGVTRQAASGAGHRSLKRLARPACIHRLEPSIAALYALTDSHKIVDLDGSQLAAALSLSLDLGSLASPEQLRGLATLLLTISSYHRSRTRRTA